MEGFFKECPGLGELKSAQRLERWDSGRSARPCSLCGGAGAPGARLLARRRLVGLLPRRRVKGRVMSEYEASAVIPGRAYPAGSRHTGYLGTRAHRVVHAGRAGVIWRPMKYLSLATSMVLAGLASGCSKMNCDSDPAHAAVSVYIKKNLSDPESYQAVRWGKVEVWTKAQEAQSERDLVSALSELARREGRLSAADSLAAIDAELKQIKDTSRVGLRISHRYRKRDAQDAIVFDSITLLVSPAGKVITFREAIRPDIVALAHTL